ncbi:hypothetical protein BDV96DRAFT_686795 [Lophiotrema nucula]|uniref:Uncharacterized protein n=1 Tax=Lophiotrema nucula TaxID=690887 RepID=A0A6A5ZDK5_9PLEO|nr:hypothetical protein BDV96DRAFT_686795 [Lophiotrema nucula]
MTLLPTIPDPQTEARLAALEAQITTLQLALSATNTKFEEPLIALGAVVKGLEQKLDLDTDDERLKMRVLGNVVTVVEEICGEIRAMKGGGGEGGGKGEASEVPREECSRVAEGSGGLKAEGKKAQDPTDFRGSKSEGKKPRDPIPPAFRTTPADLVADNVARNTPEANAAEEFPEGTFAAKMKSDNDRLDGLETALNTIYEEVASIKSTNEKILFILETDIQKDAGSKDSRVPGPSTRMSSNQMTHRFENNTRLQEKNDEADAGSKGSRVPGPRSPVALNQWMHRFDNNAGLKEVPVADGSEMSSNPELVSNETEVTGSKKVTLADSISAEDKERIFKQPVRTGNVYGHKAEPSAREDFMSQYLASQRNATPNTTDYSVRMEPERLERRRRIQEIREAMENREAAAVKREEDGFWDEPGAGVSGQLRVLKIPVVEKVSPRDPSDFKSTSKIEGPAKRNAGLKKTAVIKLTSSKDKAKLKKA